MRRILGITLALAALGTSAFAAENKSTQSNLAPTQITAGAAAAPQWQRGRRFRGPRQVTRTRTVRIGRRLYRETYVVRYFPNGRSDTRLISRVRIS